MIGCTTLFSDCSIRGWHCSVIILNQGSFFKERFAHHVLHLRRKGLQLKGWRSGPERNAVSLSTTLFWLFVHSVSRWMRFTTKSRWEFTSTWCWCGWSCWAMPRWAACSISLLMSAVWRSSLKAGRPQLRSCCSQWERLQPERQRLDLSNYDSFPAALSELKW